MLKIKDSGQFKKDYKKCVRRGLDMNLLKTVVAMLAIPAVLPQNNQDHNLKGNYKGYRECHVLPDWLCSLLMWCTSRGRRTFSCSYTAVLSCHQFDNFSDIHGVHIAVLIKLRYFR